MDIFCSFFTFFDTQVSLAPTHVSHVVLREGFNPKVYFPKVHFPKVYVSKVYFLKCIFQKCIVRKYIFGKCISVFSKILNINYFQKSEIFPKIRHFQTSEIFPKVFFLLKVCFQKSEILSKNLIFFKKIEIFPKI